MNRYTKVQDYFDTTHRDLDESIHLHGHRFTVEAIEQSEIETGLEEDLHALVLELHLRDLGQMLVGGSQTLQGLASWFMERLLTQHPRTTSVEIWYDSSHRAGITRTVR